MNEAPEQTPDNKTRITFLDLLRLICFLVVICYHYVSEMGNFGLWGGPDNIRVFKTVNLDLGAVAVALFFMVSGASLMLTYEKRMDIVKFAKRTFLRILLPFYIAYGLLVIVHLVLVHRLPYLVELPAGYFLLTLTALDGYVFKCGILTFYLLGEWFLGALIIMYLVFPALRVAALRFPAVLFGITAVIFILLNLYYPFSVPEPHINVLIKLFDFIAGMVLIEKRKTLCSFKPGILAAALISAAVFIYASFLAPVPEAVKISFAALGLFVAFMQIEGFLTRSNALSKVLKYLSTWQYEIYLVHHVVIAYFLLYLVTHGTTSFSPPGAALFVLITLALIIIYAGVVRFLPGFLHRCVKK